MRLIARCGCLLLVALISMSACDRSEHSAKAESADDEVRELTPRERVTLHLAETVMADAFDSASSAGLREVELDMREKTREIPESIAGPDATKLTIFFAANNRGEREDCGCRKNPLGGLARRHTMLETLTDEAGAAKVWGELGPSSGTVFHVDAGDALFKNATLNRGTPAAQKIARHDADAVVEALNTFPPDAMLAGELEFAFGLDTLQELAGEAEFPIVTANVKTSEGDAPFPGSVVVERDGLEVGVVGVTKQKTRLGDYWSSRKLEVEAPLDAARREIAKLPPDVDAVVLLSNLGLGGTRELVEGLGDDAGRLALVVISGTNRLTGDPEFTDGVPIVEPLSRGKYVGRAELTLNGDTVAYRNAAGLTPTTLRDYRRAIRSYWTTRKHLARQQKQLAELEARSVNVAKEAKGSDAAALAELDKRRAQAIESRAKRVETMKTRLSTVSESLQEAVAQLKPTTEASGDDWIVSNIVPVKIEIAEEPSTRRVVSRNEKTRPSQKEGPSHPRRKRARKHQDKKRTGTPAMPEQ